jgi:hypothetical protein
MARDLRSILEKVKGNEMRHVMKTSSDFKPIVKLLMASYDEIETLMGEEGWQPLNNPNTIMCRFNTPNQRFAWPNMVTDTRLELTPIEWAIALIPGNTPQLHEQLFTFFELYKLHNGGREPSRVDFVPILNVFSTEKPTEEKLGKITDRNLMSDVYGKYVRKCKKRVSSRLRQLQKPVEKQWTAVELKIINDAIDHETLKAVMTTRAKKNAKLVEKELSKQNDKEASRKNRDKEASKKTKDREASKKSADKEASKKSKDKEASKKSKDKEASKKSKDKEASKKSKDKEASKKFKDADNSESEEPKPRRSARIANRR